MTAFLLDADINEIVSHLPIGALKDLAGKHVVITGGRGFLGRYFTAVFAHLNEHHLVDKPVRVTCIDNLISAGAEGARIPTIQHVRFVNHDVCQPFDGVFADAAHERSEHKRVGLAPAPEWKRIDFILHAAGIASPAHYRKHPLETLEVATMGTKNALELARANPGCRITFFSSSEIYGDPDATNVPTKEEYRGNVACLGPRACYDMSKRLGETMAQIYQQQFGVHATMIRPFNVYGPGMQKTDYRVLPNFAARLASNQSLQAYGTGTQTRTYCYVTDAINGFLRVLLHGRPGEPYNIGNPSPEISVLDLARMVPQVAPIGAQQVDIEVLAHPESYPADEPNRRCPDISKAARELGYAPRVSLEEGLTRFFGWALPVFAEERAA